MLIIIKWWLIVNYIVNQPYERSELFIEIIIYLHWICAYYLSIESQS